MTATLTIGEIARRAGVATSAIRYYESVGVLPEPARVHGRRRYAPDTVRRLAIVDIAQRAGFTLGEIADLLNIDGAPAHQRMRALAERKLPEIDALIRRAEAVRRWLEMTRGCDCNTVDMCSLFDDRLLQPDDPPTRRAGAAIEVPRPSMAEVRPRRTPRR